MEEHRKAWGNRKSSFVPSELLYNAIEHPHFFQRKHSRCLKTFPLKTRGELEVHFSSAVKQSWNPKWTSPKETMRSDLHPQRKKNKKCKKTHADKKSWAGQHGGFLIPALSTPWHYRDNKPIMGKGSAPSRKQETHAVEKNTRTHTYTHWHMST